MLWKWRESEANTWVSIAMAHAEAAEIELKKVELLAISHPSDDQRLCVRSARVATSYAYTLASEANQSFLGGDYKAAVVTAQRAHAFFEETRFCVVLCEPRDEDVL